MENTKDKTTVSRRKCKHITSSDRQIIEKLYRKGYSVTQIADLLGFHRSSIYRELHRGRVIHLNSQLEQYVTYSADRADDEAGFRSSAHGPSLKIANDFALVSEFNHLILHHKLSLYAARQVILQRGMDVRVSLRTLYNYVHRFGFPILPHDLVHRPKKHAKSLCENVLLIITSWLKALNIGPNISMTVLNSGIMKWIQLLGLPAPLMFCSFLLKGKPELSIFCS